MYICECCNVGMEPEELFLDENGRTLCANCFAREHYNDLLDYCEDYIREVARDRFAEETDGYDFEYCGYNHYASGVRRARCEEDYEELFNEYVDEVREDIDLSDLYEDFAEEYSCGHPKDE